MLKVLEVWLCFLMIDIACGVVFAFYCFWNLLRPLKFGVKDNSQYIDLGFGFDGYIVDNYAEEFIAVVVE